MSLNQIKEELLKLPLKNKTTFLNFFIQDANAYIESVIALVGLFTVIVGGILITGVAAGVSIKGNKKMRETFAKLQSYCNNKNIDVNSPEDLEGLREKYEAFLDQYIKFCTVGASKVNAEYCHDMGETKKCVEDMLKGNNVTGVNNQTIVKPKEVQYQKSKSSEAVNSKNK